jgi:outer membrane lipoprotein SlyB
MTGASSSSSNSIDARGAFARPSAAALVGGAVLVASLSAAAGWMMHAARPGQPPVSAVPMHMALAPGEAVVAPTPPATGPGPGPATALAPAGDAAGKPSPVLAPQPRPEPQPRPQPLPAVRDTAMGSGTGHAKPALRTRPAAVCERCGTVESVHEVRRKGEANGIGAVAGGVIGGVLGRQVGKGHGRDAMTVVGAVGGGLAGHEIEKRVRAETVYEVRVRMDDGRLRTVTQKTAPQPGARVVVDGSTLRSVAARDDDART